MLLSCQCGTVRDDNIIPVVVIQTTERLMPWEVRMATAVNW